MKKKDVSRRKPELLSGVIISLSLLLCAGVSTLEYRAVFGGEEALPAAASPEEFTQLSDPLLVLVNGKIPLPEEWEITPRLVDDETVDQRMYQDLTAMFQSAQEEDVWFWVASGYRSVEEQQEILDRAVGENLAAGMDYTHALQEALRTIAKPGHSEHHTGLAVDLNDVSDGFEETEAYRWLQKHAAQFGFVQRYRSEKAAITGIDNESWHYRYVGRMHAKAMTRMDLCLEEYVALLKARGVR